MELGAIRRRYLRTWLGADLVAATPYDVLALVFHDHWLGRLQVLMISSTPQYRTAVHASPVDAACCCAYSLLPGRSPTASGMDVRCLRTTKQKTCRCIRDAWSCCAQFLRLLRLAKLARVVRFQRFFRRWEGWLSINYRSSSASCLPRHEASVHDTALPQEDDGVATDPMP